MVQHMQKHLAARKAPIYVTAMITREWRSQESSVESLVASNESPLGGDPLWPHRYQAADSGGILMRVSVLSQVLFCPCRGCIPASSSLCISDFKTQWTSMLPSTFKELNGGVLWFAWTWDTEYSSPKNKQTNKKTYYRSTGLPDTFSKVNANLLGGVVNWTLILSLEKEQKVFGNGYSTLATPIAHCMLYTNAQNNTEPFLQFSLLPSFSSFSFSPSFPKSRLTEINSWGLWK